MEISSLVAVNVEFCANVEGGAVAGIGTNGCVSMDLKVLFEYVSKELVYEDVELKF